MKHALLIILAIAAVMAAGYAWATPVGQAPDESAHLNYVKVLATEHRLPVLNLEERRASPDADLNYEAHQPPLYYALAVPFYAAGSGASGDAGAGQAVRAFSILCSLLATTLIWLIARELAPDRPGLWTAAAGFAALLPMRLHINASVSNDPLAEATTSLALLLMLRAVNGRWSVRAALILGGAIALALLTKQNAILLLPSALLTVAVATKVTAAPEAVTREFLVKATAVFGVVLVLAGGWYVRNHVLYGDPLAQRFFNEYFANTVTWHQLREATGWSFGQYLGTKVLPVTFDTFWGAFGSLVRPELFMGAYGPGEPGPRWGYPPRSWLYPILVVLTLVSLTGWLLAYMKWRRQWMADEEPATGSGVQEFRRSGVQASPSPAAGEAEAGKAQEPRFNVGVGILALHALFVVAAYVNFNSTYFQAQARYLFPAMAAISLALAGGWLEWARKREVVVGWGVVTAGLILAAYGLFGVLVPGFRSL